MLVVVKEAFQHDLDSDDQRKALWWRSKIGFILWVLICLKWRHGLMLMVDRSSVSFLQVVSTVDGGQAPPI